MNACETNSCMCNKKELGQLVRKEARGADEGLLKDALQAMEHPRLQTLQTMFKWKN